MKINQGHTLFKEGDQGNLFYVVNDGKLDLLIEGDAPKTLTKGDTFGEIALLDRKRRSGTVSCLETAFLYCLEGSEFREIMGQLNKKFIKDRLFFLSLIPLFSIIIF